LKRFDFEIVAGTATAGIPWASWISDELHKPLAYIRSSKKGHGTGNQIEGAKVSGKSVVIIEDLISTGGSSFSAVEAVREAGGMCTGVVAIFTYEFQSAIRKFLEGKCELVTLTSFSTLMHVAKESGTLNDRELKIVLDWHENPQDWRR
jgi:orotate phosphoribosyltransferase